VYALQDGDVVELDLVGARAVLADLILALGGVVEEHIAVWAFGLGWLD